MQKNKNSTALRISVLVVTLGLFGWYAKNHWTDFLVIKEIPLVNIFLIMVGQTIIIFSNIAILKTLLKIDHKNISWINSTRITAYSSLINFFGFLQAGVGFRGAYLKKYYKLSIKKYLALTTVQYGIFFGVSAFLIIIGYTLTQSLNSWPTWVLTIFLVSSFFVILWKLKPKLFIATLYRITSVIRLNQPKLILYLVCFILLQLIGSAMSFGVGLKSVGAELTFGGFLLYVGLAQFAIIFAVTPGAIGIREGLLLLVQYQMLLTTQDIILASTIDRIIYCITLLLISPFALAFKKRLDEK